MVQPFLITADEVNCLIHSYFQDSGFTHSAFVLHAEGRLDKSAHFGKHVPRGELVELLSKALLYAEVEAHWRGNAMTTNCKTPFSLLERHICSLDPALPASVHFNPPPPADIPIITTNGTNGSSGKRKASTPASEDVPKEKRARTEEMEVDSVASAEHPHTDGRATIPGKPVSASSAAGTSNKLSEPAPKNAIGLLKGHDCEVYVCAWNPMKQNSLATGAKNAVIKLWNIHDSSNSDTPPYSDSPLTFDHKTAWDKADLTSLDWSRDGTLLAAGSYDAILRICDASGQLYFSETMQKKGPVFATRFSKSGQYLLTASLDGTVCVWDVRKKSLFAQYNCHEKCCLDVEWLSNDIFASAGADSKIQIMRVGTSTPLKTLSPHSSEINQLKCNPSQTRLASCSDDATARIFDVNSITDPQAPESQVLVLTGHSHTLGTMAWCPRTADGDHELLVTASFDGTARLWDSVNGECLAVFSDHTAAIYTTTFSTDGRFFATAGGDGELNVYDVKKRARVWSWRNTSNKCGIFEIDWQTAEDVGRLAMALESGEVGIIDTKRIPALQ